MVTIGTNGSGIISKPPEEVWDYMVEPSMLHRWVKNVEPGGNWLDDGSADVVGSRYRIDYAYGRKTNEVVFEITVSESPSRFGVNTVSGPYPITADYLLTPSADGLSTNVEFEMVARSDSRFTSVIFVLTGWVAKFFMKRQLNKELVDLEIAVNADK